MLPECRATLERGLRELLPYAAHEDLNGKVPELFSGNPWSPIWFVALNPAGGGYRPTWREVLVNPGTYVDYYSQRFAGCKLVDRPDRDYHGEPLSDAVQAFLWYTNAFAEGAGIAPGERWRWVMKLNAYGAHAPTEEDLNRLPNRYFQYHWIRELVQEYRPALVVGFRVMGHLMVEWLNPLDGESQPDFPVGRLGSVAISWRAPGRNLRSNERVKYFRTLGMQWAAAKGTP